MESIVVLTSRVQCDFSSSFLSRSMAPSMMTYQALATALLASTSWAMPQVTYASNTVDLVPTNAPQPLAPGSQGSLRGSQSLVGYASSQSDDPIQDTVVPPSDYQLAPGQSEDPDLGLYLDLNNVLNPQPIRGGTNAPTDPGPRECSSMTFQRSLTLTPLPQKRKRISASTAIFSRLPAPTAAARRRQSGPWVFRTTVTA